MASNTMRIFSVIALSISLAACGSDSLPAGADAAQPNIVPTSANQLFTYLQDGAYNAFPSESQIHDSAGPHGRVRTYINPALDASLRLGNPAHPIGAAAITELYNDDERDPVLIGWAVMVKTEAQSNNGQGWYWYEVQSTTDGSNPTTNRNGDPNCSGCHESNGNDLIQTAYPLR